MQKNFVCRLIYQPGLGIPFSSKPKIKIACHVKFKWDFNKKKKRNSDVLVSDSQAQSCHGLEPVLWLWRMPGSDVFCVCHTQTDTLCESHSISFYGQRKNFTAIITRDYGTQ